MKTIAKRLNLLSGLMVIFFTTCVFTQVFAAELQTSQSALSAAQSNASDQATHAELRTLRDALFGAWEKRDIHALLMHVAPDAVVTWQNGEVSRGHLGIQKFYQEMVGEAAGEKNSLISEIKSTLKIDELSILYGHETAIVFGSIHDEFTLNHAIARASFLGIGETISLDSRWTATIVKMNDQWKLASYHVSTDVFSNPILAQAIAVGKRLAILAGIIGLIPGAIVVWIVMRRRNRNASIR